MIKNIFLKELQYNLLNSKILITWGVLILLFIFSTVSSSVNISSINKSFDLIEQANNKKVIYDEGADFFNELIGKRYNKPYEKKNGLDVLTFTKQNFVKKLPALAFISDTNDDIPDGSSMFYFLTPFMETNASSNIYLNALYSLNWNKIFRFILSFIIVCFSYDAFSREKEQGTLKLMLANKMSRLSIVMGKYLGLLITFLIPFIVSLVITMVIIGVSPELELLWVDTVKLLLFTFTGIIFLSINVLIGFMISCLSKSSVVSLSISLIVWALLAIIFPSTTWLGINKIKPIPTITEVNDRIRTMQDALKDCSLSWRQDWVGKAPGEGVLARKDCFDRRTKIVTNIWQDYYNRLFSQTGTAINIASISPFSSFQFLCDKLTDNGYYGYKNFYNQVLDYQKEFRRFIDDRDRTDKNSYHLIWNESYTKHFMSNKKIDIDEIPRFEYKLSSVSAVLKSSAWNIFYMSVWAILLFAGVCIAFFRCDVR